VLCCCGGDGSGEFQSGDFRGIWEQGVAGSSSQGRSTDARSIPFVIFWTSEHQDPLPRQETAAHRVHHPSEEGADGQVDLLVVVGGDLDHFSARVVVWEGGETAVRGNEDAK